MAANKRTKTEREAALAKVAELDRDGFGQVAIARMLGVSQPQICYDLKQVRKRYRETQLATVKAAVNEKLDQLRQVRCEAWAAWDTSGEKGRPNPTLLTIVLKALHAESELLGLYPSQESAAPVTPQSSFGNDDLAKQYAEHMGGEPAKVVEQAPCPAADLEEVQSLGDADTLTSTSEQEEAVSGQVSRRGRGSSPIVQKCMATGQATAAGSNLRRGGTSTTAPRGRRAAASA
jgi:hypothetical protein